MQQVDGPLGFGGESVELCGFGIEEGDNCLLLSKWWQEDGRFFYILQAKPLLKTVLRKLKMNLAKFTLEQHSKENMARYSELAG